jgi:hypothetical protein
MCRHSFRRDYSQHTCFWCSTQVPRRSWCRASLGRCGSRGAWATIVPPIPGEPARIYLAQLQRCHLAAPPYFLHAWRRFGPCTRAGQTIATRRLCTSNSHRSALHRLLQRDCVQALACWVMYASYATAVHHMALPAWRMLLHPCHDTPGAVAHRVSSAPLSNSTQPSYSFVP